MTSFLVAISSSVTGSLKIPKLNPVSKAVLIAPPRFLVPLTKPSLATLAYLPGYQGSSPIGVSITPSCESYSPGGMAFLEPY